VILNDFFFKKEEKKDKEKVGYAPPLSPPPRVLSE
jgi:hypothetical protein